ncbi:hypothetical protein ACSBR2_039875 [Camellia fascicularis]
MVAETTTFPIDITKTRLQLHGESLSSSSSASALGVAGEILRREGLVGLYKGLSPAIVRHMFYTPIRIVCYEHLRNTFVVSTDPSLSLSTKALIGGFSGVIAQVVASPADLVKVRMQADGRMVSQGLQPRYLGPFDAFNKILETEEFGGLWKVVFPNVERAFLVNMGELACYDHAKHFREHYVNSPFKTRMMNQTASEEGKVKYRNSYDCLVKTVRVEGLRALWKGFFPTWARLGHWQFVFWVSYEKFRRISGLSSF